MKKGFRIAACGAICHDEIVHLDGRVTKGFGGILYSVAAFASVLHEGDHVVPLTIVGRDHYSEAKRKLLALPHVDVSAVGRCDEPSTHVRLVWESPSERHETVKGRMPAVSAADLARVHDCAAVHFNFINGTEIDLATLAPFRKGYKGLISLDVHQLISHFDDEGHRTITGFPDWRDWAPHIDIWQSNEYEATAVFGPAVGTQQGIREVARELLALGPRIVCITLGPDGVFVAHWTDDGAFCVRIEPYSAGPIVDTTGCGDSFSAGLLSGLFMGQDALTAAARGVVVAGETACLDGIQPIANLEKTLWDPRRHFQVFRGHPALWAGEPL